MLKKLSMVAIGCLVSFSSVNAGEFTIGTKMMKSEIEGNFTYKGTDINTKDTLGMTKKDTLIIPKIGYVGENNSVFIKYESAEFSGDRELTASVTFDGTVYTASTDVHSEINTKWATLGYRYHFDPMFDDKLDLKIGTDIHVIKLESKIESELLSRTYDVTFGLPTLAVDTMVNVYDNINLGAEVSGMILGSYGHYLEYDAKVHLDCKLVEGLSFDIGYKAKEFDLENNSDEKLNLEWSGVYAGATYSF